VQILFPHVPDEANSNLVQTVFKQVYILHSVYLHTVK